MEYSPKITCEAQILICPVYVTFYDGVSSKNNLWNTNKSNICPVYVTFYDGIFSKITCEAQIINLICPVYVIFYDWICIQKHL